MDLVDDSCARQQCRKKVYFSNKIIKKKSRKKTESESHPEKNKHTRAVSFWRGKVHLCTELKTVNCGKKQKLIMRNDIFFLCVSFIFTKYYMEWSFTEL